MENNSELIQLLRQLEWSYESAFPKCRICDSGYKYGHLEICSLASQLEKLGEEVKRINRKDYPE